MSTDAVLRDVTHAVRALVRCPGFTLSAVLSLGVGFGLNTAVFSAVDTVLLQPFPYKDSDALVFIWGSSDRAILRGVSGPDLNDWRTQSRVLEDIAAFVTVPDLVPRVDGAPSVDGAYVDSHLFPLLGVSPILGRTFTTSDIDADALVIGHGLWRDRFGSREDIPGQRVDLGGRRHTIVGVMPEGFFFPDHMTQIWAPLSVSEFPSLATRGTPTVHGLGRLRPGRSLAEAQTDIQGLHERLLQAYPDTHGEPAVGVMSFYTLVLGSHQRAFWSMLAAASLVLLLACANVANLLLVRHGQRLPELSIRVALGATRAAITRQLLVEAVVLAAVAWAVGLGLAAAGIASIRGLTLVDIPRLQDATMNWRVLSYAGAATVVCVAVFGAVPAARAGRLSAYAPLFGGGTGHMSRRASGGQSLVIAEVAIATILLVTSGLLLNSFVKLSRIEWGFEPSGTLIFDATLGPVGRGDLVGQTTIVEDILERLTALPAVEAAGMGYGVPINRYQWTEQAISPVGRFSERTNGGVWTVSHGYFQSLRIPIQRGRGFSAEDSTSALRVAVVSDELASVLWPGESPIGKSVDIWEGRFTDADVVRRLRERDPTLPSDPSAFQQRGGTAWQVVGVVGHVRMFTLDVISTVPALYVEYRQQPPSLWDGDYSYPPKFVVRTSVDDPLSLVPALTSLMSAADPAIAFQDVSLLEEDVARALGGLGTRRLLLLVSLSFGSLAWFLAATGVYSIVASVANERAYEFAVRRAVGASHGNVIWLASRQSMHRVLLGLGLGLTAAWAATGSLESLLYGVDRIDPLTLGATSVALFVTAAVATLVPAARVAWGNTRHYLQSP